MNSLISGVLKKLFISTAGAMIGRCLFERSKRTASQNEPVERAQDPRQEPAASGLRVEPKFLWLGLGAVATAAVGLFYYANRVEVRRFRLEEVDIITGGDETEARLWRGNGKKRSDPDLTLSILHLSDLHLCYPEQEKIQFIREITEREYDLIVLTGDVFENYTGLAYASKLIVRPPRYGAYAVLGNHDYYDYTMFNKTVGRIVRKWRTPKTRRDVEPMIEALRLAGFDVLLNESRSVPAKKLHIVGVDYPGIARQQLIDLTAEAPEGYFKLALFHLPRRLEYFEAAGTHLAVGGHTHGGQVRLPGLGAIITDSELSRKHASGVVWRGNTAFHVSRGLGADPRTNIRFLCPPAATILNIKHYSPVSAAKGGPH